MPEVLDWRSAADPRPLVYRAARALAEGEIVAFPTDTVYALAASALIPEAVEKLYRSKKRDDERPMTLAVRGADEALDWVPEMSPLGRRLTRRCWPGPVTFVFGGAEQGLVGRLPDPVRRRVCPSGSVGLRAPAHGAILGALQLLSGPLVLSSANPTGAPPATTATAVVEALGADVPVVLGGAGGRRLLERAARRAAFGRGSGGADGLPGGVRLHRKYLPQSAGRGAIPEEAGRPARLRRGRPAGARISGDFRGPGGDDGGCGGGRGRRGGRGLPG
jgi:tRNA threonylcarbamoyl adenosine modification protein (Sua5/YciO/YrdC/YwlC family)